MRRSAVLGGLAALPSLAAFAPLAAQTPAPVRIATIPADIGAECWYAEALGSFRNAGIAPEIMPFTNAGGVIEAVASAAVDVGFANLIMASEAFVRGIPLRLLAPANLHDSAAPTVGFLAANAGSPIASARDLEGKTIALNGMGGIVHFATRDWIDKHGGDSTKVRFIEFPLVQMPTLVLEGRVDAAVLDAVGFAGERAHLKLVGNTFDAIAPRFVIAGWITTSGWMGAHPALARDFAAIMRRTASWANAHHQASAEILAQHTKLGLAAIVASVRVTYGTALDVQQAQPSIDAAARYGALPPSFNVSQLFG